MPETAAPVPSVTVPRIEVDVVCANSSAHTRSDVPRNRRLFMLIPSREVIAANVSNPDACVNVGRRLGSPGAGRQGPGSSCEDTVLRVFCRAGEMTFQIQSPGRMPQFL